MGRARRNYFRVPAQIGHEVWTNDQVAAVVRLQAHLQDRWSQDGLTAEQAAWAHLGPTDIMRISGRHRVDVARKSVERLADIISISVEHRGDVTVIHWPKWSVFQGLPGHIGTEAVTESVPKSASSPAPSPAPSPAEIKNVPEGGGTASHDRTGRIAVKSALLKLQIQDMREVLRRHGTDTELQAIAEDFPDETWRLALSETKQAIGDGVGNAMAVFVSRLQDHAQRNGLSVRIGYGKSRDHPPPKLARAK